MDGVGRLEASLIDDVLVPNLPRDGVILEIGPGGWSLDGGAPGAGP